MLIRNKKAYTYCYFDTSPHRLNFRPLKLQRNSSAHDLLALGFNRTLVFSFTHHSSPALSAPHLCVQNGPRLDQTQSAVERMCFGSSLMVRVQMVQPKNHNFSFKLVQRCQCLKPCMSDASFWSTASCNKDMCVHQQRPRGEMNWYRHVILWLQRNHIS